MKKLLTLLLSLFVLSIYGFGQYSMAESNGHTIYTCSGNLSMGDYTTGQTYILTISSDDPIIKHIKFSITEMLHIPIGDTLYFYDGNSTEAPIITYWENSTSSSQNVQTTLNNGSGCLTLLFTGNHTGASLGTNNISCNFVCQPREVFITSTTPPLVEDTYINICWDEENNQTFPITFNAQGNYPALAYECNDATNIFTWHFNDGSPAVTGFGLTSVTHTFPECRGYNVMVSIKDSRGCINTNLESKIARVALPPIWDNSTTVLTTDPPSNPPTICMGSLVNVCAYYSNPQWNSNVVPITSEYAVCVPDTPPLCYESTLIASSLEPNQIITSIDDIISIDMILAHDFLGDLTFYVICPNGQQVQIGAQGGGMKHLGVPGSNMINCEGGEGWLYSITPTATQTMQEVGSSLDWGTISLPSGEYASYQSLSALIGCPLNGPWQLKLCDNWSGGAGIIYEWSIQFNESLTWNYGQTYTPTLWEGLYGYIVNEPNNQNCMTGTYITSNTPYENSLQSFTFTVTDDFGCTHDTSLYVTVRNQYDESCCQIPDVNAGTDDEICALTYPLAASEFSNLANTGNWEMISGPDIVAFNDINSPTTQVTVSSSGTYIFRFHERYSDNPECASYDDVTITFLESPIANAGEDTLFCGKNGYLNAVPSSGTGYWSTPTEAILIFENINDPNTYVEAAFTNTSTVPYYELIWTEENTNGCTDADTIKVTFARIPRSDITIIPPKCFGEPATIVASEDSLIHYTWNFYSGIIDSAMYNIQGGNYLNFVHWTNTDTLHRISLVASSSSGCQSIITVDTIFEPPIPNFEHIIIPDTCSFGKGGIIFVDTLDSNVFTWLDPNYGPYPGTAIRTVYNIPEGDYPIATTYLSPNIAHYAYYHTTFGTTNCLDTIIYTIESVDFIKAEIALSPDVILDNLIAPNAKVIFLNNSDCDNTIIKRCEWYFDDGTPHQETCNSIVEHTYTENGCFDPFLVVINENLPECRDTARLQECILIKPSNISSINVEAFSVSPNPASEVLYINCDIEKAIVQIFDINGKLVHTDFVFSNSEINISELVSGTYIIILSAENGKTGVQKFVKE